GKSDGDKRIEDGISSASILVNGIEVFGPEDFNQNTYLLTSPLELSWDNTLSIDLASKPETYITVEISEDLLPPSADLTATPEETPAGEAVTLRWDSNLADTVVIEPDIGAVDTQGEATVFPMEDTTYTLTATGLGGTSTEEIEIRVLSMGPLVSFNAKPQLIEPGEPAVLQWAVTGADTIVIDNGVGVVPPEGSITLYPDHTAIYRLSASGPSGNTNARVVLTALGNPEPQPKGSFGKQYEAAIPADATVPAYNPEHFSVITGVVTDCEATPLENVFVFARNHLAYGTAATDMDGRFSLPVEGGKTYTLMYEKEGLIDVHRNVYVPWNDVATADTVQMTAEDPVATSVGFDGNPQSVVVHRSSEIVDALGARSFSLVFSGDNHAYLLDDDGNDVHELSTLNVRATEYPTPESMPADLPPTSAYTYCVELTVDGAESVRFENPVVTWLDNFLGFEVGETIPVGFYDRAEGMWKPSNNGVVVRLLDTNNDQTVDALDKDGDGLPDDLNGNGAYDDEVQGLENPQHYPPGSTFWRVGITHFSPCDLNMALIMPPDGTWPNAIENATVKSGESDEHTSYTCNASFVDEKNRVFYEDIPIPGTGMKLYYSSGRVEGYNTSITVPASGDAVPASLKKIAVEVKVAGKILTREFQPLPNQTAQFYWDGRDYLGNPLETPIEAHINVGWVYDAFYARAGDFEQAFGQPGTEPTAVNARQEITVWNRFDAKVHPARSKAANDLPEGWSLSTRHHLNLQDLSVLYKGNGTSIDNNVRIVERIAGTGSPDYSNSNQPALSSDLNGPYAVAVDIDGNVYFSDTSNRFIRKIDTHGILTDVTIFNGGFDGDGGPAADASVSYVSDIEIDREGNIYLADTFNHCIRVINNNGIINTVAGIGQSYGFSGDGGPATQAQMNYPRGIAVDDSGNLYISDSGNGRIRKVDTNGVITTIAGGNSRGYSGDGGPAIDAQVNTLLDIDIDGEGNLYFCDLDSYDHHIIRKIDTNGIVTRYAGTAGQRGYSGDGGPAIEAQLKTPKSLAIDRSGNVYIADGDNCRIRMVNTKGIITTVAGSGQYLIDTKTGPAPSANFRIPTGIAVDDAGNLYIADSKGYMIRKASHPAAFNNTIQSGANVFSEDTGIAHIVSIEGLHTETIDLDTGSVLYTFGYDDEDRLIAVTDRFGNTTEIERDSNGTPTSIISPDGLTTTLSVDADNFLDKISYPDGRFVDFDYAPKGLLALKTEPEGNGFAHVFDANGRLIEVSDDEGGLWNYASSIDANHNHLTEMTTAEGDLTSYLDSQNSSGEFSTIITDPSGARTTYRRSSDRLLATRSLPCGMDLTITYDLDEQFMHEFPSEIKAETPSGLTRIFSKNKAYSHVDRDGIFEYTMETLTLNGKATTIYNDLQAYKTITSPEGRMVTESYDPGTLLTTALSVPGFYDTNFGYDAKGRLSSVSVDTRQTLFSYNTDGFLESVTGPENQTTAYTYDEVGRVIRLDRPDNTSLWFSYDLNGNMTVMINPSDAAHHFGFNAVNLNDAYITPLSGSYHYEYDLDRRLSRVDFPSGKRISNIFSEGRLVQVQTPEGNIDYTYLCGTKVDTITKGEEAITFAYDGPLMTAVTAGGALNQAIYLGYDDNFKVISADYAGAAESITYDSDGLMTGVGNFSIVRNPDNGLPEAVSGGNYNLARTFNGFGEISGEDATICALGVNTWHIVRDPNGRIVNRSEVAGGVDADYSYTYDPLGRLLTVTRDGALIEEYRYGLNGSRTYEFNLLRGITGRNFIYSEEDHLLAAGPTAYQYDADGFLKSITNGDTTTAFDYSSRGELLRVTLPDGTLVEYGHDPLGRRITKKVDGLVTEKYLWQGLTRLLAVYDGADNLLARFEYADGRMPLAMSMAGTTCYLGYDQVGSLRVVADAEGNVLKRIEYDAFGSIVADSNPGFETWLGFAGGLHDRDINLIRFGHRDYDPQTGRWTAKDPILFDGGDTDLYGYCLNDPVNGVD
ncbi:MAG: hypothetical protein LJE94_10145, partial [Deltaproteobacteria bacterium]|nr:hypothetical protein [Deltaproteobacteria bacterium]